MNILHDHIALHTWTLDSTPFVDILRIARQAGYNALELRYADFMRCRQAGMTEQAIEQSMAGLNCRRQLLGEKVQNLVRPEDRYL